MKVDGDPEQDLYSSNMKRAQWQVKKSNKKANKKSGRERKPQRVNSPLPPMEIDPIRLDIQSYVDAVDTRYKSAQVCSTDVVSLLFCDLDYDIQHF